jgi:hypothetical protein
MSFSLARCYFKTFYGHEVMPVYVDGHFKAVWTLKNIPKGKHGMMERIMPGLKEVFLNGQQGHPLLHKTCPGDRHLTKELIPIVEDFEDAIGREVVNLVIVDGEVCSLGMFEAFDVLNKNRMKKMYLLTSLDSNQYRFDDFKFKDLSGSRPLRDEDFVPFRINKKGKVKSRVALVEFDYLSNANRRRKCPQEYFVRCAVVKKLNGNLSVIVTNIPYENITSGIELANLYYNRWPCQEAKFKEMKRYCNLKVNHGFKKREVFNRLAADRLQKAEKSLKYNLRRLEKVKEKGRHVKKQITKRSASAKKQREYLEGQIMKIRGRLNNVKEPCDDSTLRCRLDMKIGDLGQLEGRYNEKMNSLQARQKACRTLEKKILKLIDEKSEKVALWRKRLEETAFYELETEMDHIMTTFKILFENSLLYVKDEFFGGSVGLEMLLRCFVNHYGTLEIFDSGKRLRFKLDRFDGRALTKKAKKACTIFNGLKIKTADGILLEMAVKR